MPGRRRLTEHGRRRAREKFWHEHGEKLRLALIGGGAVVVVSLLAKMVLH